MRTHRVVGVLMVYFFSNKMKNLCPVNYFKRQCRAIWGNDRIIVFSRLTWRKRSAFMGTFMPHRRARGKGEDRDAISDGKNNLILILRPK